MDTVRKYQVGMVLVAVSGLTLGHYIVNPEPHPWNPLGDYPVQTIETVTPETIEVTGVKCVRVDYPVTVEGQSEWQSINPAGTSYMNGAGTAVRHPAGTTRKTLAAPVPLPDKNGCTTFHFINPIPNVVLVRSKEFCQSTGVPATWQLAGKETPSRNAGTGVPRAWRTASFKIPCG